MYVLTSSFSVINESIIYEMHLKVKWLYKFIGFIIFQHLPSTVGQCFQRNSKLVLFLFVSGTRLTFCLSTVRCENGGLNWQSPLRSLWLYFYMESLRIFSVRCQFWWRFAHSPSAFHRFPLPRQVPFGSMVQLWHTKNGFIFFCFFFLKWHNINILSRHLYAFAAHFSC